MNKYNWTQQEEQLLITWAEKSSGYSWLHTKSINHYRYKNLYISIPAAILSYIAGSTTLIIHNNNNHMYLTIIIGFFGIIAGILVNLQEIFRYKELSEQHRSAGLRFLSFFRDISTELSLHPNDRSNSIDFIKAKKNEYGKLLEESPVFPQSIIKEFEEKFKDVKIHKPDIGNNLQTIMPYSLNVKEPSETDMEDISEWLKKRRINNNNLIEVANSSSDVESNTDFVEFSNNDINNIQMV